MFDSIAAFNAVRRLTLASFKRFSRLISVRRNVAASANFIGKTTRGRILPTKDSAPPVKMLMLEETETTNLILYPRSNVRLSASSLR